MLRIHFTAADLGLLRLALEADPLWESLLSQHVLASGHGPPGLGPWRRRAMSRLTQPMRLLMKLAPATGYSADFLTPTNGLRGLDAGIDSVRATPPEQLHADLNWMASQRPLPGWARGLADGDIGALRGLTAAMRDYFEAMLASTWERISGHVAVERAGSARTMTDCGVERLLVTLHPAIRWEPPVLHISYPAERDVHLDGRGLVLLPSYFCWRTPVTLRAPERPPVLVYPIEHRDDGTLACDRQLTALLGRTRAAVLCVVQRHPHGCTTSELARALNISLSSASEHASTLRRADLLRTKPSGKNMLHVITKLGHALVAGKRR